MQPAHWQVASWCGFVGTISLASGIGPCGPGSGLIAESGGFFFGFIILLNWYPWTIPRCRPVAYQATALPLSYKGKFGTPWGNRTPPYPRERRVS